VQFAPTLDVLFFNCSPHSWADVAVVVLLRVGELRNDGQPENERIASMARAILDVGKVRECRSHAALFERKPARENVLISSGSGWRDCTPSPAGDRTGDQDFAEADSPLRAQFSRRGC